MNKGPNRGVFKGKTSKTQRHQDFVDALRAFMRLDPLYGDPYRDEEERFYKLPPTYNLPASPSRIPPSVY